MKQFVFPYSAISYEPNTFVSTFVPNVFVDPQDLRVFVVTLFARSYFCAGTELTWDYM